MSKYPARHWEISPNDLNKIILPVTKISVSSGVDIKSLPVCPELATLSNSEQNLKQSQRTPEGSAANSCHCWYYQPQVYDPNPPKYKQKQVWWLVQLLLPHNKKARGLSVWLECSSHVCMGYLCVFQ